jgi:hypothetical protein
VLPLRRKNTPFGKPPAGVFWQQISIKPFVGVCVVGCCSTNIEKKVKHPFGKASRWGALATDFNKAVRWCLCSGLLQHQHQEKNTPSEKRPSGVFSFQFKVNL